LEWQPVDLGVHAPREAIVGAVVANEYLDALPVHRLVQRAGRILERYVGFDGERFVTVEDEPSSRRLPDVLAEDGVELRDDQAAEVSLKAIDWASGLGAELERGIALVIDYGHDAAELFGPRRSVGTLMTYAGHEAGDDPYVRVGSQDITAHVDLTAVDRAARQGGLDRVGSATQARFLASLGLAELLSELGRRPGMPVDDYLLARSAVGRMLDPRHLGGFAVRAWGRGIDPVPPLLGFGERDANRGPAPRP
jgi:SAM-dependent MidA family methyltransferase